MAIKQDQSLAWNSLKQLENDFVLYGKYNGAQLQDIVSTVNGLQNRSMHLEKLLTGQDLYTLQIAHMTSDVTGRMTFMYKLNLYVHNVLERQIRLYEWLLRHLKDVLDSISILSTGHPHLCCFHLVLQNITTKALQVVHKSHPNHVSGNKAFDRILWHETCNLWCRPLMATWLLPSQLGQGSHQPAQDTVWNWDC